MIKETLFALSLISTISFSQATVLNNSAVSKQEQVLSRKEMGLTNRLPNEFGNRVFADNILLSLHYLKGDVDKIKLTQNLSGQSDINWDKAREPFEVSFTLKPGEVFAYHNNVLDEYKGKVSYSMNSRFYMEEGYKSLGGLGGNGVCHLASLINWVSKGVGLEVVSHVNHDFSPVNGIPREYGSSIFYAPSGQNSKEQNLYIRNNFNTPVRFEFKADEKKVVLEISKQ